MQNSWSKSWDQDKLIKKKLKIIKKLILKENNAKTIRSYEVETPTNQMSKDKTSKKKNKGENKENIRG